MLSRLLLAIVLSGVVPVTALCRDSCGAHGTRETMLVSTAWLQQNLQEKNIVLLAVGKKEEYAAGHVPGSTYLDFADLHTSTPPAGSSALILELPPPEQVRAALVNAGVRDGSRIILYSTGENATLAARVYLTLDDMGLGATTSILDGGLPEWRREGHAVTEAVPAVVAGQLQLCPRNDVVVNLHYVRSEVHGPNVVIVDARLAEFYSGEKIPPQRRAGHIPGAVNIPFASLLDENGRLLPTDMLRQKFESAGVKSGTQVITYCHIGQQASLAYFAARYMGYDARMFDGSWQEWSAHTELPAETSRSEARH